MNYDNSDIQARRLDLKRRQQKLLWEEEALRHEENLLLLKSLLADQPRLDALNARLAEDHWKLRRHFQVEYELVNTVEDDPEFVNRMYDYRMYPNVDDYLLTVFATLDDAEQFLEYTNYDPDAVLNEDVSDSRVRLGFGPDYDPVQEEHEESVQAAMEELHSNGHLQPDKS